MAKISDKVKQKIMHVGQRNRGNSMWINTKDMTTLTLRVLADDADGSFGTPIAKIWSTWLKKFIPTPRAFGFKCPVLDIIDAKTRKLDAEWRGSQKSRQEQIKEEKKAMWAIASGSEGPVVKCVITGELGTVDAPRIRLFEPNQSAFTALSAPASAESTDITHPTEGSWCKLSKQVKINSAGKKKDEWVALGWGHNKPISLDPKLTKAIVAEAATIDIKDQLRKINWADLGKLYKKLTGKPIPDSYMKQPGIERYVYAPQAGQTATADLDDLGDDDMPLEITGDADTATKEETTEEETATEESGEVVTDDDLGMNDTGEAVVESTELEKSDPDDLGGGVEELTDPADMEVETGVEDVSTGAEESLEETTEEVLEETLEDPMEAPPVEDDQFSDVPLGHTVTFVATVAGKGQEFKGKIIGRTPGKDKKYSYRVKAGTVEYKNVTSADVIDAVAPNEPVKVAPVKKAEPVKKTVTKPTVKTGTAKPKVSDQIRSRVAKKK